MEDLFGGFQNQGQFDMQGQGMYQQSPMQGYQDPMQQQMLMQQQQYGGYQSPMMQNQYGGYPQMDYNQMYSNPQGSMDRYGNIKYSKAEYLEGLRNYIMRNCNFQVTITKEEKIEDIPPRLRHCCVESRSKIVMLDKLIFSVPETGMNIPFYFCRDCGKLFYYKDFMM